MWETWTHEKFKKPSRAFLSDWGGRSLCTFFSQSLLGFPKPVRHYPPPPLWGGGWITPKLPWGKKQYFPLGAFNAETFHFYFPLYFPCWSTFRSGFKSSQVPFHFPFTISFFPRLSFPQLLAVRVIRSPSMRPCGSQISNLWITTSQTDHYAKRSVTQNGEKNVDKNTNVGFLLRHHRNALSKFYEHSCTCTSRYHILKYGDPGIDDTILKTWSDGSNKAKKNEIQKSGHFLSRGKSMFFWST